MDVPTITSNNINLITLSHWGFRFDFSQQPINNAQSEKLLNPKSSWYHPFQEGQFCILPVDSFYEFHWKDGKGKIKVPHRIGLKDFKNMGLAGLYQYKEGKLETTVLTMDATGHLIGNIHNGGNVKNRAPFILKQDDWNLWLKANHVDKAYEMISLIEESKLDSYPISRDFNKNTADTFSQKWHHREDYIEDIQGSLF